MDGVNTTADLTDTCWRDDLWLHYNQLNSANVIREYFSLSPFYDANCNNEILKQQNLEPAKLRTLPPGIEYILHTAQEPHLYVIKKQFRHGPDSITAQAYYYVHTGTIYQAPTLHAAVSSRWKRCVHLVHKSFTKIQSDLDTLLEWRKDYHVKKKGTAIPNSSFTKEERERFLEGGQILMATIKNFPAQDIPAILSEEKVEPSTQTIKTEDNAQSDRPSLKQEDGNIPVNDRVKLETEEPKGENASRDLVNNKDERKLKRQKR